ncbi:GtrA family protein [Dysgonomonas sp. 216]|uniref:GtrA family protein n=1 Tax=Dysgonomonas sp. 216 TaxID=2302934 RepID=UPI0013D4DFA2|nr:GtrA family protein [Dysgonomonas sp. 216]
MNQSFKQLVKYGLVGVAGLVVDFLFFIIFRDVVGLPYWVAQPIGAAFGILNNFILNSYFTFKTTDNMAKRGISFFAIGGIGLVASSLLLPWCVTMYNTYGQGIFEIQNQKTLESIMKIGVTLFVAFVQFFANKYITFRQKNEMKNSNS